jgi:metallo-beta-lactamase class B
MRTCEIAGWLYRGARGMTAILAVALAWVMTASPAQAQLTIRLSTAATVPAGRSVHIAGSFNAWNPSDTPLSADGSGHWSITLPETVRGNVEFKFTLGSWATVETSATGGDVANRSFAIPATGPATLDVTVAGWRDSTTATRGPPPVSTATHSVTVLSDSFSIPQLGRSRRVWIYLPRGYARSARRYPVLYMHDGQNVFDAATSFAGEWGVDETLDSLRAQAIVVAVDNGGAFRLNEYNPWKAANTSLGGGEGDRYLDFLVTTLKPYIDKRYRTRRDPAHTGIMGSSMGGLISLYAVLKRPDVFGRAGVFSCACWVARPYVYELARTAGRPRGDARIFFVAGELETRDGEAARDQREMVDTLVAAGWRRGANVRSIVSPDGRHSEWFWRREFPAAFSWLFR